MSKKTVIDSVPKRSGKGVMLALICFLSLLIVALTVLLICEATGVLYGSDGDDTVEITPPVRVAGTEAKDGAYTYCALTDGTAMIISYDDKGGSRDITVASTLGGMPLSAIGESAFALVEYDVLRIPEGVTYIGRGAFYGATGASVYLPSTLEQIGENIFDGAQNMVGIYFAGTQDKWKGIKIGASNSRLASVICAE